MKIDILNKNFLDEQIRFLKIFGTFCNKFFLYFISDEVNLENDKYKYNSFYRHYCENSLSGYLNSFNLLLKYVDDKEQIENILIYINNFISKKSISLNY